MAIEYGHGDLLAQDVDALINTVNTEGAMGKGIALQFKKAWPAMYADYSAAARRGEVVTGRMHVWETGLATCPRFIINFPTKRHWRTPSRLSDIAAGLKDLRRVIADHQITSIALPALGCGNGGLQWTDVEPLIRAELASIDPTVRVVLYPPSSAPKSSSASSQLMSDPEQRRD
ncbi:MAG: macro domain-containing protein [Propionicimonas sp.]